MKLLHGFSYVTLADYYLAFQSFDFVRTWWRLFQKRVVRTKFDIYVFIIQTYIQSWGLIFHQQRYWPSRRYLMKWWQRNWYQCSPWGITNIRFYTESQFNNVLIMRDIAKYFKGNEVFNIRFLFQVKNYRKFQS
jgi:hypothetical protein